MTTVDTNVAPVRDGILRIVLTKRNDYTVLRAELIKNGEFTTLAIDRFRNPSERDLLNLRREGVKIARAKRVRFEDEIAINNMKERMPYGRPTESTEAAVLAHDHPCVRP